MLSEEEKKAIDLLKNIDKQKCVMLECPVVKNNIERQLKIIELNRIIRKQSKEIEELKITKKELTERVLRLESDEFWNNVVSKDKINAKIEPKLKELDEQINEEWKKYGNSKELQDMEDMYNFFTITFRKGVDITKKEKQELEKIIQILEGNPYIAYTFYGDILYESDEIAKMLKIFLRRENKNEKLEFNRK